MLFKVNSAIKVLLTRNWNKVVLLNLG